MTDSIGVIWYYDGGGDPLNERGRETMAMDPDPRRRRRGVAVSVVARAGRAKMR